MARGILWNKILGYWADGIGYQPNLARADVKEEILWPEETLLEVKTFTYGVRPRPTYSGVYRVRESDTSVIEIQFLGYQSRVSIREHLEVILDAKLFPRGGDLIIKSD